MKIVELNDYHDIRLQHCFRTYFEEIGEKLKENTKVFDRMQKAVEEENMHCHVILEEDQILGFIQFQEETLTHKMGFLSQRLGLIREFWIAPSCRGKGYGTALLRSCEGQFAKSGVKKTILTYEEDALGFYQKHGYVLDTSYQSANMQGVVVKNLD